MSLKSKNGKIGAVVAGMIGLWFIAGPASAQSSEPIDASASEETSTVRPQESCDCPCPKASQEQSETKIIYVGPRQNVPMKIKSRKRDKN